jgi:hypothetical protein
LYILTRPAEAEVETTTTEPIPTSSTTTQPSTSTTTQPPGSTTTQPPGSTTTQPPATTQPPGSTLRFITVGDIHTDYSGALNRLKTIVSFIDQSDVDFAVYLGDISGQIGGSGCSLSSYNAVKTELEKSNKPYFILAGNHDTSQCLSSIVCNQTDGNYIKVFGYYHKVTTINNYQIIIASWCNTSSLSTLFNQTDKNKPSLVFTHGPVLCGNNCGTTNCKCNNNSNWATYFDDNFGMKTNHLNQFTKLIAVYSGHVHDFYNQICNNTRYVIEHLTAGSTCSTSTSNYIGYTKVNTDYTTQYARLNYNNNFVRPF